MCLGVPGVVKNIEGMEAQVELGGVSRTVSLIMTPEAQVGDYVLVHTGFAISVIDEEEAQETLRLLAEFSEVLEAELGAEASEWMASVQAEHYDPTG